jgi:small subunit ribosomal protein S21
MRVEVYDNNVEQALRMLRRKLEKDSHSRDLRRCEAYEKPSARRRVQRAMAIRKARKRARRKAMRDGLTPKQF